MAKPVIVATQMLESMVTSRRPTRAEVSDVANAVLDGADALMLSAETSVGRWPIEAVRTMALVIAATEQSLAGTIPLLARAPTDRGDSIARAAATVGSTTNASALVAFTRTGTTARRLSALRHPLPLLAFTPERTVQRQLALSWGVESFVAPTVETTDEMIGAVNGAVRKLGCRQPGEIVIVVAGAPPGEPGGTNTIRVHDVV
jgi:pyruvate kinase